MKHKTIIIAEAGVNHNGKLTLAKKLIDVASNSKANYVKFQLFEPENTISKFAKKAKYQNKMKLSHLDMAKKLYLNIDDHLILKKYSDKKKIKYLVSVFDIESLNISKKLKIKTIKIPSGEITNIPLLEACKKQYKKIILSTGMSDLKDVKRALSVLKNNKNEITLLHCHTDYPTHFKDVNLNSMITLNKRFKTKVGFSDHTNGIYASLCAVAMGASIIEKHFTINKRLNGPDHKASLNPQELENLVSEIRNVEMIKGSFVKKPTIKEMIIRKVVRKSIVATNNIKKGEIFTSKNIGIKRPGIGISPIFFKKYLNKRSNKNYKVDQLIKN